jgi:uncharacterized protein (TIGR02246 family)
MSTATVTQELLELEKKYWQAIKDHDAEAAAGLTDETCIVAGPSGVAKMDRRRLTAMMNAASYELNHFELDPKAHVRLINDDVAIIAYEVHEDLTVDGKSVSVDAADSSIWVRRDGKWLCAMHTEAIAGDPYGRDKSNS